MSSLGNQSRNFWGLGVSRNFFEVWLTCPGNLELRWVGSNSCAHLLNVCRLQFFTCLSGYLYFVKRWDWPGEKFAAHGQLQTLQRLRRLQRLQRPVCCKSPSKVKGLRGRKDLWLEQGPCAHQFCPNFFWWHAPMPQLCTRMQNKAAMLERKTRFLVIRNHLTHNFTNSQRLNIA